MMRKLILHIKQDERLQSMDLCWAYRNAKIGSQCYNTFAVWRSNARWALPFNFDCPNRRDRLEIVRPNEKFDKWCVVKVGFMFHLQKCRPSLRPPYEWATFHVWIFLHFFLVRFSWPPNNGRSHMDCDSHRPFNGNVRPSVEVSRRRRKSPTSSSFSHERDTIIRFKLTQIDMKVNFR